MFPAFLPSSLLRRVVDPAFGPRPADGHSHSTDSVFRKENAAQEFFRKVRASRTKTAGMGAAGILVSNKKLRSSVFEPAKIPRKPKRAARRIISRSPTPGAWVMSISRIFNRLALAASLALALFVTAFGQVALAQSAATFRDIHVDVQPLRANAGDPTATWVQEDLPGQLAQALAGRITRERRSAHRQDRLSHAGPADRRDAARQRDFGQYSGRCSDQRS